MNTIAQRVKWLRTEGLGKKMSRREFAEPLGISEGVIQNIEEERYKNGEAGVPTNVLNLICLTYHVMVLWLTQGVGEVFEQLSTDALIDKYMPEESDLAKSIMKSFAKLPDEEWVRLRDLIDRVKKEAAF